MAFQSLNQVVSIGLFLFMLATLFGTFGLYGMYKAGERRRRAKAAYAPVLAVAHAVEPQTHGRPEAPPPAGRKVIRFG